MKLLYEQDFLVERVEASKVVSWCRVRKVGCPRAWILSVLMRCSHAGMDNSYFYVFDLGRM